MDANGVKSGASERCENFIIVQAQCITLLQCNLGYSCCGRGMLIATFQKYERLILAEAWFLTNRLPLNLGKIFLWSVHLIGILILKRRPHLNKQEHNADFWAKASPNRRALQLRVFCVQIVQQPSVHVYAQNQLYSPF